MAGFLILLNPLSANPTQRSNTLKQFVGKLARNCLSVFVGLVVKVLYVLPKLFFKIFYVLMNAKRFLGDNYSRR